MNIIQLQYLVAVANCGSFSIAADQCFVTQPSLSMQVKSLEEELGVILLDRTKKPVIPTEIGAMVIHNAKEAIKVFNHVKQSVSEVKGEVAGTLRLGVIPTIAPYLIHRLIPVLVEQYPKIILEIVELKTPELISLMNKDAIDVAIIAGGVPSRGITEHELFDDHFYAYVSPQNQLFDRSNVRIEDIVPKELLLLSEGNCLRDQILELCQIGRKSHGNYLLESGSIETLMRIVDNTNSITIIPEMAIPFVSEKLKNQVKPLAKGASSRKISIAVRRTYVKNSLVKALRETIIEVMR